MRIKTEIKRLKLSETFSIAHGTYDYRNSLIICLQEDGATGFGEAVAIDYYGYSIDDLLAGADQVKSRWNDKPFPGVRAFYVANKKILSENSFALSAFDCAAHDLAARTVGKPWREWMGWDLKADIHPTSRTIGFGSFDQMKDALSRWADWPSLKIKLGQGSNISLLKKLLQVTSAPLRIDANGSWSIEDVRGAMTLDASLPLQFIEQPLPVSRDKLLKDVTERRLPIIADESFRDFEDVSQAFEYYDGVNIKLMKCGGLTPAIELIKEAKQKGFTVMMGCMTESSIGITAAAQIASACDFVDLDGALLLEDDPAFGVEIKKGLISLPIGDGLGIGLKES